MAKFELQEMNTLREAKNLGYRYIVRTKGGKVLLLKTLEIVGEKSWYYDADTESMAVLSSSRFLTIRRGMYHKIEDIIA